MAAMTYPQMRDFIGNPAPEGLSEEERRAAMYADAGGRPVNGVVPPAVLAGASTTPQAPAPEDPILAIIKEGRAAGMTDDAIERSIMLAQPKKPAPPNPTADMNFADNMTAAMGGRAVELGRGAQKLLGIGDRTQLQKDIDQQAITDAPLKDTWGGKVGGAITDIGTLAGPMGMIGGGVSMLPKVAALVQKYPFLSGIGLNAAGSAAQSAIEPVTSDETQAGVTGRSMAGGAIGGAVGSTIGRMINPVREAASPLVKALLEQKVPLSAGQRSGHPFYEAIDRGLEAVPGGGLFTVAGTKGQREAATKAASRFLGGDETDRMTAEFLAKAEKRISDVFEQVGNAAPRPFTPQLGTEVAAIVADARVAGRDAGRKSLPAAEQVDAVQRRLKDPMLFSGTGYNTLRHDLTNAAFEYGKSGNHLAAETAGKLRDAIDAEAKRHWGGQVGVPQQSVGPGQAALTTPLNPTAAGPAAALPDAWEQYAVLKDLTKPGVVTAEGIINPTALRSTMSPKERLDAGDKYNAFREALAVIPEGKPSGYQIAKAVAATTALGAGAGLGFMGSPVAAAPAAALAAILGGTRLLGTHAPLVTGKLKGLVEALRSYGQTIGSDQANP